MPDGKRLARALADRFNIKVDDSDLDLAKISSLVQIRHDRDRLVKALRDELSGYAADDDLRWLLNQTWKAIFTTNYDTGIEDAYREMVEPTQTPVSMATNSEIKSWDPSHEIPVFHLHGSLESDAALDAILLTERDYAIYDEKRNMLFNHFKIEYPTSPILYVGYSNQDPNWREITTTLQVQFSPSAPPKSFRLAPDTPPIDRELLAAQGIETIDGTIPDLRAAWVARFGELRVEPTARDRLKAMVPSDLSAAYAEYPSATIRLLNSWEYVNQADFSVAPNTESFYKGNRANWGIFAEGQSFERDIEKPVVDRLVDFVTSPTPRMDCAVVLAPAGYGTTTLLLAAAAWYVRHHAGPIFVLRPGATPSVGDMEFAAKHFDSPPVFIVDNASDFREQLASAYGTLRSHDAAAFFLMGARLNEWHQLKSFWSPLELQIEPLSDGEIFRLIETLETEGQLGRLADLPQELQYASIKDRHQQELLVTMREVTEGRAFDVIIESEFFGITESRARDLYGFVCAFSRVRALARDQLLADAINMQISDLYALASPALEGIVIEEEIDEAREIYGLRARHQTIADIVWDRCLNNSQREEILLSVMDSLNLTYGFDAKVFEMMTRDEYAIDSLRTFDTRVRFFDRASRKDPDNVYVRQHFARMLRREGKLDMALAQIELAIKMAPRKRLLHHTKGLILGDLASGADSLEVGRRYLGQAEQAFDQALAIDERDEYSYQSLADVYLDWAKKVGNEDEQAIYLGKAQEALLDGLDKGRELEYLYVMESRIQSHIGDTPGQLGALRKALEAAPSSANVRYLLGSALRAAGLLDESESVLREGLSGNTADPRLALSYTKTLLMLDRGLPASIAILEMARARGLRDPAFIAAYGGLLRLNGDVTRAEQLLVDVRNKSFSARDQRKIVFVPSDFFDVGELSGVITHVAPGFAFVKVDSLGDFFLPGSQMGNKALRLGTRVRFVAGFTIRGGTVHRLIGTSEAA
ncbi:tetratricopeptide (TPR) repeat protein [Mycolicibacterium sp. BK634]|uniref:P-loop NTPase n=1 Tax=Mycolicibacterium sp. BK634 TaxID=2587099 RepID=UPI0018272D1C|nr:SIR2 family protein [Mycolicibacterium sp. BK634]MBB3749860.1 tetratricopeptide (TPR) repeat protein [Mycolicibacterium sp. BK634]